MGSLSFDVTSQNKYSGVPGRSVHYPVEEKMRRTVSELWDIQRNSSPITIPILSKKRVTVNGQNRLISSRAKFSLRDSYHMEEGVIIHIVSSLTNVSS